MPTVHRQAFLTPYTDMPHFGLSAFLQYCMYVCMYVCMYISINHFYLYLFPPSLSFSLLQHSFFTPHLIRLLRLQHLNSLVPPNFKAKDHSEPPFRIILRILFYSILFITICIQLMIPLSAHLATPSKLGWSSCHFGCSASYELYLSRTYVQVST